MIARKRALSALIEITENGAYANLCLKRLTGDLSENDAARVHALTYAVLDHLYTIDFYLAYYVKGRLKRTERCILRSGVCELLYMRTPAHAAVNESVCLCKAAGKTSFSSTVNAVLRRIAREKDALPPFPATVRDRLSVEYSYPLWLTDKLLAAYGAEFTESLFSAKPAPLTIRAQYPYTDQALAAVLDGRRTAFVRGKLDSNAFLLQDGHDFRNDPLFADGQITIQGEGAMLACRALGDCRGKTILDACAAPGGKSAYLMSLAENKADICCFELHTHRTAILEKTLTRLHVPATVENRDASVYDPAYAERFDAVFLDAPCSGLGLIGSKPDVRYSRSPDEVTQLCRLQSALLDCTAQYVRIGGILIYATCTILPDENEAQIKHFLETHKNFIAEALPFSKNATLQLFPGEQGTEGFFMARMKRCS